MSKNKKNKKNKKNSNDRGKDLEKTLPAPSISERPLMQSDNAEKIHFKRMKKIHWVHDINIAFVAFLMISILFPSVLLSSFGLSLYAAEKSYPRELIARGDLMVSRSILASQLQVDDLLLIRTGNLWQIDGLRVLSASTIAGKSTIVATTKTGFLKTFVFAKDSSTYIVTRRISLLGYFPLVYSRTVMKILLILLILVLNLQLRIKRLRH